MRIGKLHLALCIPILLLTVVLGRAAEINLSAASSLKEVLSELTDAFSGANPGVVIRKNFGASGTLAKQIESGAPADLFIAANREWVSYLLEKKLLAADSYAVFAYNDLVFVGSGMVSAANLREVTKLERVAIGSPKSVPAGEYAMAAFRKAGLEKALEGKLIMAKDVRESLLYAERGEVDGAFVYRTDARLLARNARILFTVPRDLYPRVEYPLGLTVAGALKPEAMAFSGFLRSVAAKAVLTKHGFELP